MKLNGFRVDPELEKLINRSDWCGRRTSTAWLSAFEAHPDAERMTFVELCSQDSLTLENGSIWRRRKLGCSTTHPKDPLAGVSDSEYPPGDVDVNAAYLIGFTDYCDSGIYIDLRPSVPRVVYDNLNPLVATYATAFDSVDTFVEFFLSTVEETR